MEPPVALDRAKLAKILELTGRDIDAEALAFMRKANEMAYAAGGWMEVLCPKPEPGPFGMQQKDFQQDKDGDWSPPHLTDKTIIETMFRAIYAQPRSDNEEFWQWVDSVHQFWLERHRLTPKQYSSIRKCYVRAVRSGQ
jgi:hypothetical protein